MIRFALLFLMTCTPVLGAMPTFANAMDLATDLATKGLANKDSTAIKVSVVHDGRDNTRMNSTGTVLSGNRIYISRADIKKKRAINLGTLTINSVANYDVAFKSANGYRLKDANGTLAEYKIEYDGKNIVINSIHLNSKEPKTSVYQDILTVIITAP